MWDCRDSVNCPELMTRGNGALVHFNQLQLLEYLLPIPLVFTVIVRNAVTVTQVQVPRVLVAFKVSLYMFFVCFILIPSSRISWIAETAH